MPPKRRASQHGAQSGSNNNKVKSINNVIRQTKNKYKSNRLSSIKSAKANAIGSNISLQLQTSSSSSQTTSLGEIASFCQRKDQGPPLSQSCSSSLSESKRLRTLNPDLLERLVKTNEKYEMLMRKLAQQQVDFTRAMETTRVSQPIAKVLPPSETIGAHSKIDCYNTGNHSKQLDRLLRYIPAFNGRADENYDSYVIGIRQTLEAYANDCSEDEKLSAVRVKIGGDAREVLASSGTISSVEALINAMHVTYGRDQRTTIAEIKQKSEETVRMFSNRLRMNLKLLGWVGFEDPLKPNIVSLEFFINGLLPSISDSVRRLCPRNLDIAGDYAIQLESQKSSRETNEKNSKFNLNNLSSNQNGDDLASSTRSIKDQITALSAQLREAINQFNASSSKYN